jgi:hypothetical protein
MALSGATRSSLMPTERIRSLSSNSAPSTQWKVRPAGTRRSAVGKGAQFGRDLAERARPVGLGEFVARGPQVQVSLFALPRLLDQAAVHVGPIDGAQGF